MQVFIAGCGRSGTSYLRTLVDAHPCIHIPSESLFIVDYLRYEHCVPKSLWRWLLKREPQLLCWYEQPLPHESTVARTVEAIHRLAANETGAVFWGQKTPRFVRHRCLLQTAFPDSRWVLLYRDPRDVISSMKRSGQHTSCIPLAARRWRRDNEGIATQMNTGAANSDALLIAYEKLIGRTDKVLSTVWAYLDVTYLSADEAMRRGQPVFFSRSRFEMNTVRETLVPNPESLGRWRHVLREREIEYIEYYCGDVMKALGYSISGSIRRPTMTTRFLLWLKIMGDVRILIRYVRYWPEYPLRVAFRKAVFRFCFLIRRLRHPG